MKSVRLTLSVTLIVCAFTLTQAQSGGFIARLGNDTTFMEKYSKTGNIIEGDIISKFPRATKLHYKVTLGPNGSAVSAEHVVRGLTMPADAAPLFDRKVTIADSIVTNEIKRGGRYDSAQSGKLVVLPGAVPWIANSFAMYEQQIRQARAMKGDSVAVEMVAWGRTGRVKNYVKRISATQVESKYFDDPVWIKIDGNGLLQQYDGSASTSKLLATRTNAVDLDGFAKMLAASEAAGNMPGALSPRDTVRTSVAGAQLQLDYGRPQRRGRTVWGNVIPWGKVWRTGANAATQFSTTKDLLFGSTTLPAGKYTLWSLPTESGTKLIINKQTGQWGTEYDGKQDFAQLEMNVMKVSPVVDQFLVTIPTQGSGGTLTMVWENTQLSIPFTVR